MSVTPDTVVIDVEPDISAETFEQVLEDGNSPATSLGHVAHHVVAKEQRVSPAFALAIFRHESQFGKVGLVPDHDLKNPGATRSTRTGIGTVIQIPGRGPFVRYPNWVEGWRDLAFRLVDPSFVYVKEGRRTIRQIIERWAPASDNNVPTSYINAVVKSMNEWIESKPVGLSETIMQRIAAKGIEIHDIRGQMTKKGNPETRPASAWKFVGVHHTAVSRGVRNLQGDIDSWRNHSSFHVNTRGWPTIAYFLGASLSGRMFLLHDIEIVGYHAFAGANYQTLAICADMTSTNTPTDGLLKAMKAALDVLDASPELPNLIGRTGVYGHQELKFLDPQNDTGCPGALLPWVQAYRKGGAPNVVDPNAWYAEATGHWIVNQGEVKMLDLWKQLGGLGEPDPVGYPLTGMTLDEDGVYRQLFENRLLEWRPGKGGRSGGLGQRYMAVLSQVGRVQLAVSDEDGTV